MSPFVAANLFQEPKGPRMNLSAQAKAIATAIVTFLLQVQVYVGQGGIEALTAVTLGQWISVVIGTLGSYGIVYSIPNTPKPVDPFVPPAVEDAR